MSQAEIDRQNSEFWNELCGTQLAHSLGITDFSADSLAKFDRYYMATYPYLAQYLGLEKLAGKDVLEIGLGYGTVSQLLAAKAKSYTGLDIAAGPVAVVNQRMSLFNLNGTAQQGSILEAPFADASFDAIVTIGCLHHTGNLQRALDEVHRLLRPGGTAMVMIYNAFSYRRWWTQPASTAQTWWRDYLGVGGDARASDLERGAYDRSSSGASAPSTVFTSRRRLRAMCARFSEITIHKENADQRAAVLSIQPVVAAHEHRAPGGPRFVRITSQMTLSSNHDFTGRRVLVTGGAGFVGSNLVRLLLDQQAEHVHIVDNLLSAVKENVADDPRVRFTEASITDDRVLSSLRDEYDYVFHLCTYHGNQSSIHNPLADHENNTLTTLKLYETIKGFGRINKVVYSGAGCAVAEKTFGEASATEESDVVSLHHNDSPYSMSKIFGEFYSVYYHKQHAMPTVRARFQNVYGPGEVLGAGRWRGTPATVWRNVTPTFIYKSINGDRLPIENEGIATRDFIFVGDVARGLAACALHGAPGDVYNIASGVETSIRQLATAINALTGNAAGIEWLPKRAWDNSGKRFGSTVKAERELGWRASVPLADGLERTVRWTKDNLELIRRSIRQHQSHLDAASAR